MANFLDFVAKKAATLERSDNEVREPEPKNGYLNLPKDTKMIKVRVLPSVEFIKGEEEDPMTFGEENLRIFFNTTHKKQDMSFAKANWNVKGDRETLALIDKWTAEGKMMTPRYGNSRPRKEYLMNVIQLDDNNQMVGQPMVYRAPRTVYEKLVGLLKDTDTWLEGSEMGWMDPNYGTSIKISLQDDNSYDVRSGIKPLPPIDFNAVAAVLEPLSTFTQPSRLTSPDYYKQVVEWMEGAPEAPTENPYAGQQAVPSQGFGGQAQSNFNTAPSQPAFQQPVAQPNFNAAPAQPMTQPAFQQPAAQQNFNAAPSQPAFQQPVEQPAAQEQPSSPFAAPAQPVMPFDNPAPVSAPSTGDTSLDDELRNILGN